MVMGAILKMVLSLPNILNTFYLVYLSLHLSRRSSDFDEFWLRICILIENGHVMQNEIMKF